MAIFKDLVAQIGPSGYLVKLDGRYKPDCVAKLLLRRSMTRDSVDQ
jgi:hypothetical protein